MADRLNTNEGLARVGPLVSNDGSSTLLLQGDGNVVLYRSTGVARWASGTNNAVSAVMQGDGNFVVFNAGHAVVWATGPTGSPSSSYFLVVQDDGNLVIYGPNGPIWASNTVVIRQAVPGFLPSSSGFRFSNSSFLHVPDLTINVLGNNIKIGDASNGLCGGMVYAARDYFEAGLPIPPANVSPSSGPLFDYLVKRLFDSFDLVLHPPPPPAPLVPGSWVTPTPPWGPGPLTYMHLMDPALPDNETWFSLALVAYHGRAWVMINDSWPKIKADIDTHRLSPIALVELKNSDPTMVGHDHQVLAYGYFLDGTDLTLRLYDPNAPSKDDVTMSLSIAHPESTTDVNYSLPDTTVWCFFRPIYTFSPPPVAVDGTLLREENGAIWVVFGGAIFHMPDPPTLERLYGGKPIGNGDPEALSTVPVDGTLLREENGAIWVVFGGAIFHVPDLPTLERLYSGKPIGQLWNGGPETLGTVPVDGTLLREENGAIWVVFGGAISHVPDLPTLERLYSGKPIGQLWNEGPETLGTVPVDGTLLREESSAQVYVIQRGTKVVIQPPYPGTVNVLWDGALAQIPE